MEKAVCADMVPVQLLPPMRTKLILSLFAAGLCAAGASAEPMSAFQALKLLSAEQLKALSRVEGVDGTPTPERWYLIVHDPSAENGFKELVVNAGAIVAERGLSQFVESVGPGEVIGASPLKIDSDRLAKLLRDTAKASKRTVAAINYELRRESAAVAPYWKVTALDVEGRPFGAILVSAEKGTVLAKDGFVPEGPKGAATPEPPRFGTYSSSQVSRDPDAQAPPPVASPATPAPKKPGVLNRLLPGRNRPSDR